MNRIIVDEYEKELENISGILELKHAKHHIYLKGKNKVERLEFPKEISLIVELEDDAKLSLSIFAYNQMHHGNITINSHNQTKLDFALFLETETDTTLELVNNILGSRNKSKINVHAVTDHGGSCHIRTLGWIKEKTEENEFLEELKGLAIKEPTITFLPDLVVDSDSVIANHNATIKCFDEEELFYLESKGLTKEEAGKLIKDGFLNKKEKEEVEK